MWKFVKSLLAVLSGCINLLVIAYLLLMVSTAAGYTAAVVLSFFFGMAFKTSNKQGLFSYPVLISIPMILGSGIFTYETGSLVAYFFIPAVLVSAIVGNYIVHNRDELLSRRTLQIAGAYAVASILMITTVIPEMHVLDISEQVDEPLPKAELTTMDRDKVAISEMESDIVVIDFWATWCGKCIQMMPELERLDEKYSDNPDVKVKAVNTSMNDSFSDMKTFVNKKNVDVEVLYDEESRFTEDMDVNGVPYTVVINTKENRVEVRKQGFAPGEDYVGVMSDHIDQLL